MRRIRLYFFTQYSMLYYPIFRGKVTTEQNLDREETELYTLTIETRSRYPDQLLYHTILQVEVADENDNAPQFLDPQPIFINAKLEDIARSGLNALLGRVLVKDLDKGNNGKITLKVMPPMNKWVFATFCS